MQAFGGAGILLGRRRPAAPGAGISPDRITATDWFHSWSEAGPLRYDRRARAISWVTMGLIGALGDSRKMMSPRPMNGVLPKVILRAGWRFTFCRPQDITMQCTYCSSMSMYLCVYWVLNWSWWVFSGPDFPLSVHCCIVRLLL